jgi:RNA polymerase sigma-70 factor (ECF subfamily)
MGNNSSHWCRAIYESRAAELLLYGRALGLSHAEGEDVLQETFMALLQMEDAPAKPEHYCVRAFRNRALNYKRGLWRRITREFESLRWFEKGDVETGREKEAMACLATLPPDQREVIVLKIWHEYTFEEIGELLDLSPNTAAGRYRYGLQKLRACLEATEESEEMSYKVTKLQGYKVNTLQREKERSLVASAAGILTAEMLQE